MTEVPKPLSFSPRKAMSSETAAASTTGGDGPNVNMLELEETVARLSSHKGVKTVLILNREGDIVVPSTTPAAEAKHVRKLLETAKSFAQSLSAEDDISFLQMKTTQNRELYIAPHEGYVLAVLKSC